MKIQDALNSVKQTASNVAHYIGETASKIGHGIAEYAKKVAEYVKPHFQSVKKFTSEHKKEMLVTLGAVALGAALFAIFSKVCKKKEEAPAFATGFKA